MKSLEAKEINFLAQMNRKEKVSKGAAEKRRIWAVLILVAVLLVSMILISNLVLRYVLQQKKAWELSTQIEELETQQQANMLVQQKILQLREYNNNYEAVDEYLELRNEIEKSVIDDVFSLAESNSVNILDITYDGYGLSINCITTNYTKAPLYVQALKELPYVTQTQYNGFTKEQGEMQNDLYTFSVYVAL